MNVRSFVVLVVGAVAVCVASEVAVAGPPGEVDRARLKRALRSPDVVIHFRYDFSVEGDVDETPVQPDVNALRAALKGDDDDAARWDAVADAYRALGDAPHEKESRQKAVSYWRRRTQEHSDDGGEWAGLAWALSAAEDDDGAKSAVERATSAKRDAWKGWEASGDLLVMRALGRLAGRRFATFVEMYRWFHAGGQGRAATAAASKDAGAELERTLLAAGDRYDRSVALAPEEIELRWRRFFFRGIRVFAPGGGPNDESDMADLRKIVASKPRDPRAIALGAVFEAGLTMRDDPGPPDRPYDEMPETVHAVVSGALARLAKLAGDEDRRVAAGAFEAEAYVDFAIRHDAPAAEAAVRQALARSPKLPDSWPFLAGLLKRAKRWDELAKTSGDWIAATGDSAAKRDVLAMALAGKGDDAAAEKEWRAALSFDRADGDANAGLACTLLRRAETSAQTADARACLDAAGAAWRAEEPPDKRRESDLRVTNAVWLGLTGRVDEAAAAARELAAADPGDPAANEILGAIGR